MDHRSTMTTEPTTTQPPAAAPPPPPPPPASQAKFTQEELQAHATREAAEARRTAMREVSERLGCTVEEAEQILTDRRAADEARLTEIERRERAAEAREAAAVAREAAANTTLHKQRVRDALIAANARLDRVDMMQVDVASDADDATIAAAIKAYQDRVPEWFTASTQTTTEPSAGSTTPASDPGGAPPPPARPSEDAYQRGVERAKNYRPGGGVVASPS